jgi:hypothetical protein
VQELEVVLLREEVGGARVDGGVGSEWFGHGPEGVVVVGQVGEEDAEEEACCWCRRLATAKRS